MGIIVEWIRPANPGTEYIDGIDLDKLDRFESPVQMQTRFQFPGTRGEGGELVECVAIVRAEPRAVNRIDLVMEYPKHLNQEGVGRGLLDDGSWGTNRIFIENGQNYGDYHWEGTNGFSFGFSEHSDKSGWRKDELYEPEENYHIYRRRYRRDIFRSLIINSDDKKCVISGENTGKVLDAAHIVRAADGGAETRKNGITLRTDIHRLYDAKMFFIHPETGMPVINDDLRDGLSADYIGLLENNEGLPPETLERVQEALEKVWPGD